MVHYKQVFISDTQLIVWHLPSESLTITYQQMETSASCLLSCSFSVPLVSRTVRLFTLNTLLLHILLSLAILMYCLNINFEKHLIWDQISINSILRCCLRSCQRSVGYPHEEEKVYVLENTTAFFCVPCSGLQENKSKVPFTPFSF